MAALALVTCVLGVVIVDRACVHVTAAPAAARALAVRPAPAGSEALPLAPGACQALAPTGRGRGRTVFVDAGHGGPDPGVVGRTASGTQVRESVVALAVASELGRQLRADGYRVVLSRTGDTSVLRFGEGEVEAGRLNAAQVRRDLQARVRCANAAGAAALVSIHFNGYGDPTVGGSQTFYDAVRPFAEQNARLARALQTALVARLGREDRGILTDDALDAPTISERAGDYGHLVVLGPAQPGWLDQGTSVPGALVEPLFLTAPADASLAASSAGQRRVAGALAAGLEAFLNGS